MFACGIQGGTKPDFLKGYVDAKIITINVLLMFGNLEY